MTNDELDAIRARDAACAVPKAPIDDVQWARSNADRRALLAEVDRLRFEWQVQIPKVIGLELTVDELRSEINRLLDWQRRMVATATNTRLSRDEWYAAVVALIEEAVRE